MKMMLFGLACAVAVVDQNHDSQSGSVKYSPVGFVIVIFVVVLLLLLFFCFSGVNNKQLTKLLYLYCRITFILLGY